MKKIPEESSSGNLDRFYQVCQEIGVKVTPQRLAIFTEVMSAADHPSAEDIFLRVKIKLPMISLDTVYRTLAMLEQSNIISRVHPLDDRCRFDPNLESHHHFICLECKKVLDFYWSDFDQLRRPEEIKQFGIVQNQSAELHGICTECMKKKATPAK